MDEKVIGCGIEINPKRGGNEIYWTYVDLEKGKRLYLWHYISMSKALDELHDDYLNWINNHVSV